MPETFYPIYIQIVFAVKGRENFIHNTWKTELPKYITGTVKDKGQKSIIVNGMADLIHAFLELNPVKSKSDLVKDMKNNLLNFINDRKLVKRKFEWQEGYNAFSYSHSHIA